MEAKPDELPEQHEILETGTGTPLVWGDRRYVAVSNILAALLGAAVVGAVWIAVAVTTDVKLAPIPTSIVSEKGELKVSYSVETSPSSWEGSELDGVYRIDFQPGCVVVQTIHGSGQIFFNGRTRSLRWRSK
jgi:hypothetical protein